MFHLVVRNKYCSIERVFDYAADAYVFMAELKQNGNSIESYELTQTKEHV